MKNKKLDINNLSLKEVELLKILTHFSSGVNNIEQTINQITTNSLFN